MNTPNTITSSPTHLHQQQAIRRAELELRALYRAPAEMDDDSPRHYNEGLSWVNLTPARQ